MPNSKKYPTAFVIAILFIFIFECANAYFDNYFYSPQYEGGIGTPFEGLRLKLKNEISQSKEFNFDVLIIGDSHSHVCFKPTIIESKTGLSCFNFATFGAQSVMASFWILDNYLKTHTKKPKYLIIGFDPFYIFSLKKHYMEITSLTALADFKTGNVGKFIDEFGISKGIKFILPSLKHQGRFRKFIKNPLAFEIPSKTQLQDFIAQVYRDKGYYPERADESFPPDAELNGFRHLLTYTDLNKFSVSPFSEKYFRKILELAAGNKIKIIYHMQPMPPYLSEVVNKYPYYGQYINFVDSLKKEYPDFYVVNTQDILNESAMYLDAYHLNGKGTFIQSEFLAQKINELELKKD
ncbi:MAG: DUF1574 family protein [Nitrospirae bacterium]|nr:DUF1574 family protein [Nitrospirota bacterium]